MMAGFIFIVNPTGFWVQFLLSGFVGYLSTQLMEDLLMVIKALGKAMSFVKNQTRNVIISWENHLPYRFNLLMIW